MLELRVDDLQEVAPIKFNYEELKRELTTRVEKYKVMVYTDESISEAKDDRAALNKLSKAMNDRRISLEKEYLTPFDTFKSQVNELIGIIKEPIKIIDDQVKDFEEKQKAKKKQNIEDLYQEIVTDETIQKLLPIGKVWNDKWLNMGYKITDIYSEITVAHDNFKRDLDIIQNMKSTHENRLIDTYLKRMDLAEVMIEKARIEEQEIQLAKMKAEKEAAKEAARIKAEEDKAARDLEAQNRAAFKAATMEEAIDITPTQTAPAAQQEEAAPQEEMKATIAFKVTVNKTQLDALKTFLIENKIPYAKA